MSALPTIAKARRPEIVHVITTLGSTDSDDGVVVPAQLGRFTRPFTNFFQEHFYDHRWSSS